MSKNTHHPGRGSHGVSQDTYMFVPLDNNGFSSLSRIFNKGSSDMFVCALVKISERTQVPLACPDFVRKLEVAID